MKNNKYIYHIVYKNRSMWSYGQENDMTVYDEMIKSLFGEKFLSVETLIMNIDYSWDGDGNGQKLVLA